MIIGDELPVSSQSWVPWGAASLDFLEVLTNPLAPDYAWANAVQVQGRDQQIYDGSAFPGPMNITEIRFFGLVPTAGTLNPAPFTIEIGTTPAGIYDLEHADPSLEITDGNLDDNLAAATMQIFAQDVLLDDVFDPLTGILSFTTDTPFLFDPGLGENLLMEIRFDPWDDEGNVIPGLAFDEVFFREDGPLIPGGASVFNSVDNQGHSNGTTGRGLRTQFVPEPSAALLLGLGLLALGLRRRDATH